MVAFFDAVVSSPGYPMQADNGHSASTNTASSGRQNFPAPRQQKQVRPVQRQNAKSSNPLIFATLVAIAVAIVVLMILLALMEPG